MSSSTGEPIEEKIKPPYGAVQSYCDFLDLCERIKIDKVDTQFVQTHKLTSKNNEKRLINGLRFLGLLNEDGTITEKMKSLGVEGKPFQDNLNKVVREAYRVLFETVKEDMEKANPQDIVNCLRGEHYEMSPTIAKEGARVFVFLAQTAGIPLSPAIVGELSTSLEGGKGKEKKRESKPKEQKEPIGSKGGKPPLSKGKPEGNYVLIPDGMIRIEYQNKVLMFLPDGDKKARQLVAKMAKQFIETYEAEAKDTTEI